MKKLAMSLLLTLMPTLAMGDVLYKPVPDNYRGDTAIVRDTFKTVEDNQAILFFVTHIDGRKIYDGQMETRRLSSGKGMALVAAGFDRQVMVKPTVFTVVGRTEHAAPVFFLAKDVYELKGKIEFTPEKGRSYSVHGVLSDEYSALWIEEDFEGKMVGQKVELRGSSKQGFFAK